MTEYEEVKQRITVNLAPLLAYPCGNVLEQGEKIFDLILSLKWPDGSPMIGVLSKNQDAPEWMVDIEEHERGSKYACEAFKRLKQANFKKVIKEE